MYGRGCSTLVAFWGFDHSTLLFIGVSVEEADFQAQDSMGFCRALVQALLFLSIGDSFAGAH